MIRTTGLEICRRIDLEKYNNLSVRIARRLSQSYSNRPPLPFLIPP